MRAAGVLIGVLSAASAFAASANQGILLAPPVADSQPASQPESGSPLLLVYFYSPTCNDCRRTDEVLPGIVAPWGDQVRLVRRNVFETQGLCEMLAYCEGYGVKVGSPPAVFVGGQCVAGEREICTQLGRVISEEIQKGSITRIPIADALGGGDLSEEAPREVVDRFRRLSVPVVIAAGLVDGINPCAFTTIVFLISMLGYMRRSKRELAIVGAGFTATVFATYFLLGLGLLASVKAFSVHHGISVGVAWVVGLLALVFAGWSAVDAVRYLRTGDVKAATLHLPETVRSAVHAVIRKGFSTRGLLSGSVTVGFLVTLLESVCTGQMYLPTLVLMARAPALRSAAIGYLLIYNIMFVLPLVAILMAAYRGVRSERLGALLRRHLAAVKIALAILFAGLGLLVIWAA